MSAEHDLGDARIPVVSIDERSRFIEDVVAGKLAPDLTQVTYHFTGWLDKGKCNLCATYSKRGRYRFIQQYHIHEGLGRAVWRLCLM